MEKTFKVTWQERFPSGNTAKRERHGVISWKFINTGFSESVIQFEFGDAGPFAGEQFPVTNMIDFHAVESEEED